MTNRKRLRAAKDDPAAEHDALVTHALQDMTPEALTCRDYGHAWAAQWANRVGRGKGFDTGARCSRCGTLRVRLLDSRGGQVSNRYVYPDGYTLTGVGRLTGGDRDRLRLAAVSLLMARMGNRETAEAEAVSTGA